MAFSEQQREALEAKLSQKHVKTRTGHGRLLSYIEGWHAIAEANRIFGYDAWDRETVHASCVWQGAVGHRKACCYVARVRITVRAGPIKVVREGSGSGHGFGDLAGEAHESALKEAETDAMKRALTTFGNPFGLALYDKEQRGVRKLSKKLGGQAKSETRDWQVISASGGMLSAHTDPVEFCAAVKHQLARAGSTDEAVALWHNNRATLTRLREALPELQTAKGRHYSEILTEIYLSVVEQFSPGPQSKRAPAQAKKPCRQAKTSRVGATKPVRRKDKDHLKYLRTQPCLICGRSPSQAHHLRHAQPRAMGLKSGDEWAVPLCAIHHRALHEAGNEAGWWQGHKIEPIGEAQRLWTAPQERATAVGSNSGRKNESRAASGS